MARQSRSKVLRPDIDVIIAHDLALMDTAAALIERLSADGRRLRPRAVVAEFEKSIRDELDLTREAANCSQLRRNFRHSPLLLVPEIHWEYTSPEVLVMERMAGIPIGRVDELVRAGVDLKRLARAGVEIFFTQVFRDGFFHADMHPGNIFVATDAGKGKYIALDFGIMGTLSDTDKSYLAQNFLAFFRRDYHRVATAHIESGWVPADTRVDELEAEIRVVCEPIFDRPLKQISLGKVLVSLFRASRRFNVEIQPQLTLLQKTLLNVEGLRPSTGPRPRSVGDRQAVPRALDARPDRLPRAAAAAARGSAVHRRRATGIAAAAASETDGALTRLRYRDPGIGGRAESPQSLAGAGRAAARDHRRAPVAQCRLGSSDRRRRFRVVHPATDQRQRRAPQEAAGLAHHELDQVLERRLR